MSVCAFVLTRDRKALLVECLRALLTQTHPVDRVIVLDNASSDGTRERLEAEGLLDEPRVRYERREVNTGGAGGYHEGVRLALESGEDWIWLMDDDAEPAPDALERLLTSPPAQDPATAVLCTSVVHPDGTVDLQHRCRMARFIVPLGQDAYAPGRYADVACASFVGFLVRADVARRIDLPIAGFFLGYDDAEYSLRVLRHGRIRLVPESRIVHKIAIGGGAHTARSRRLNRALGLTYAPASWPALWKDLYRVRNFMWIKRHHGRVGPLAFAGLTGGYVVKALLYDPRPLRELPWIVRFAARGWRGDLSPSPTPQDWAQRAGVGR